MILASCLLILLEPAQLVIRPNAYNEVYQQKTLVAVCVAYGGDKPPSIVWKFGDELLTNDSLDLVNIYEEIVVHDDLEFVESVLQVCDIDMNGTGVYSCTANNSRGCDSSNFILSVVQAGEILRNCVFNTAQTSSTDSNLMFVTN